SIDWNSLQGCYKRATEMPVFLRSLLSPAAEEHRWAMEEISSAIFHQGTVYEVTPWVIPYLFELLEDDGVAEKDSLACLLAALTDANSAEKIYADTVKREIAKRFDSVYPYLRSSDIWVRMSVLDALGRMPDMMGRLRPDLEALYKTEDDQEFRQ